MLRAIAATAFSAYFQLRSDNSTSTRETYSRIDIQTHAGWLGLEFDL